MDKNLYFDAAASALKPASVIKAEMVFLTDSYANAGRGICGRATAVDKMVSTTRTRVARFINAEPDQVIFTSGATDGLNRIVSIIINQSWYRVESNFTVSDLDHHSARLPWEALLHRGKINEMHICNLDENLDIDLGSIPATDFFIITAMSNVLGRSQDVAKIIAAARAKNPKVVTIVDASQYVVHASIDVKKWDCDFMVFSGHKIGADTGLGVLYIRDVDKYSPDKFGGGMVSAVGDCEVASKVSRCAWVHKNNQESCWVTNQGAEKWEAGTLPLTQIAGLGPAIDYLEQNRPNLDLIKYAYDELSKSPNLEIITQRDSCLLSFVVKTMHPLDFGALVGAKGLCVRVGNMCAAWIHKHLGISGTVRLSVGTWNTMDEVKQAIEIIRDVAK